MSIEELYTLYKPPLFSLAYRMLGSVMDAEDVVQDANGPDAQITHDPA
jgi:RNA polymerase sigma-70 factor (ECF subfamily)